MDSEIAFRTTKPTLNLQRYHNFEKYDRYLGKARFLRYQMSRAPEEIDGAQATDWARVGALEVGGMEDCKKASMGDI